MIHVAYVLVLQSSFFTNCFLSWLSNFTIENWNKSYQESNVVVVGMAVRIIDDSYLDSIWCLRCGFRQTWQRNVKQNENLTLSLLVKIKFELGITWNKTCVIIDPLGQTHSLSSSEHCFRLKFVLFWKVGTDGRTNERTCAETMITTSRDCGSASWITKSVWHIKRKWLWNYSHRSKKFDSVLKMISKWAML